ncbi:uncharacterized protein PITG_18612 [Phytophthora infestans T30-4]|uniref:Uncharacterized protein n=1 Tax=Phytophthora infestans (strain T30-4) TaxID=403677 RepID=D0NYP2_PHYIT|nr:uncharacterized protein PITG_18612 [Phytophthora infestans T30-4]EEY68666.1 hypothetical protein PITG_18612 [Phytophthora infestans T30-4]|eukprot:XP_002997536.1 hypothetical protein PITG_18612 [Phytophthora infestans T30-4]
MGEWVWQTARLPNDDRRQAQFRDEELVKRSISWFSDGEWIVELPPSDRERSTSEEQFWPTYNWANKSWVVDSTGATLNSRKRAEASPTKVTALGNSDSEELAAAGHRAIHASQPGLTPTESPELRNSYSWSCVSQTRAIGVSTDNAAGGAYTIQLDQQPNGINWRVVESPETAKEVHPDIQVLQHGQDDGSIVFETHPLNHGIQWEVPATIANKRVLSALNKQPFRRYQVAEKGLKTQVDGLEARRRTDEWQRGALSQLPKQLGTHEKDSARTVPQQLRGQESASVKYAQKRMEQGTRLEGVYQYTGRRTKRAVTRADKPRTTTGSIADTGVANQA